MTTLIYRIKFTSENIGISGKKPCLYLVNLNLGKFFVTFYCKFVIKDCILAKYMFSFVPHRGCFIKQVGFPIFIHNLLATLVWGSKIWTIKTEFCIREMKKKKIKRNKKGSRGTWK